MRRAGGYTLVELLTVLVIIMGLAGLSIGVIAALPTRYAHEQAASQLQSFLRRARAAALETRATAVVSIDGGQVTLEVWQHLGLFRFDDLAMASLLLDPVTGEPIPQPVDAVSSGARGARAQVRQVLPDAGRVGVGLWFEMHGAYVDCGNAPLYSPPHGVRLTVSVYPLRADEFALEGRPLPADARPGDPYAFQIAAKGSEWFLWMREDYSLYAGVQGDRDGRRRRQVRETAPGVLSPGRWQEVTLEWEKGELRLLVDGLRVDDPPPPDAGPSPAVITPSAAPLLLSSPDPSLVFAGGLDEVYLYGLVAEATYALPPGIAIAGPAAVHFDKHGELDPIQHDGPVRFTLTPLDPEAATAAGQRAERVLRLERSGMVR